LFSADPANEEREVEISPGSRDYAGRTCRRRVTPPLSSASCRPLGTFEPI
jgi:hypothetical protein